MYNLKPVTIGTYLKHQVDDNKNIIYNNLLMVPTPQLYDDITRSIRYDFYMKYSIFENPIYSIVVGEDDKILNISHPQIGSVLEQQLDYLCRMYYNDYYNKMSSHDKSVELEKYITRLNELELENQEKIIAKKKEISYNMILPLINSLKANDTIKLSQLAHLDVIIHDYDGQFFLGLKVGVDKMYIIQSQYMFVHMFDNELEYRYGKNLELKHSMENFDERSQRIIKLLKNIIGHNSDYTVKVATIAPFPPSEAKTYLERLAGMMAVRTA